MKDLLTNFSKLSLDNGSRMTRKWFGNDSGMTRFSLASLICLCMLTIGSGNVWGETVTYAQTSTSAASVSSGTAPTGSSVSFSNTYSTKEQLTSGNNMVLTLTSLGGISISNITLSMKSNKSGGAGKLSYSTNGGSTWTYLVGGTSSAVQFDNAAWYGSYSQSYVNISKTVSLTNVTQLKIKIEATVSSLYCQSFQLTYTAAAAAVATPTFSPVAGTYDEAQSVTISCATAGTTIYYTTDGSTPTSSSPAYSSAVSITGSCTLKAIAKKGSDYSSVGSAAYVIKKKVNWSVNGENWNTGHGSPTTRVVAGNKVTALPTDPTSAACDGSKVFVGWTTSEYSHASIAPPTLFTTAANAPNVTDDVTYYAVFADAAGSTTDKVITINTDTLTSYASVDKKVGGITFKSTDSWGKVSWSTYTYLQCKKNSSLYNNDAFPGYIKSVTITRQPSGNYDSNISGTVTLCVGSSKQPTSTCETTVSAYGGVTFNYTALNNYTYLAFSTGGTAAALASIRITYAVSSYTYSNYTTSCCTPLGSINGSFSWSNVSPTSVTVEVPSDYSDKDNANLTGYIFKRYSASTDGTLLETIETNSASARSATFSSELVANTTYYYTITAKHESSSCNSEETSPRQSHTIDSYVVSYAAGGGSGTNPGAHDPVLSGTGVSLKSNSFTAPAGKVFVNWNDGNDDYDEGELFTVTANTTMTAQWACMEPGFSKNLSSTQVNYLQDQVAAALSITAVANEASLSYQWQKSANGTSGWEDVGTNSNEYTPLTTSVGDLYYRCIVTNLAAGCTDSKGTSAVAHIHVDVPLACLTPSFSPEAGTYMGSKNVSISSTDGATIRYTTDGTTPTEISAVYSGAISVTATTTIKAKAFKDGLEASPVASATYTIQCATPTFSVEAGTHVGSQSVTISTTYGDIYYTTDGSTPTTSSTLYSGAITIGTTQTVKAIAVKSGCENSEVASAAYTIQCATPTFSPAAGTVPYNQSVTISTTYGDKIYYTTDGSTPTTSSTLYSGAITIDASKTVKAIAVKDDCSNSAVASATYTATYTVTWSVNGEDDYRTSGERRKSSTANCSDEQRLRRRESVCRLACHGDRRSER